jgi:hypothetical protein
MKDRKAAMTEALVALASAHVGFDEDAIFRFLSVSPRSIAHFAAKFREKKKELKTNGMFKSRSGAKEWVEETIKERLLTNALYEITTASTRQAKKSMMVMMKHWKST